MTTSRPEAIETIRHTLYRRAESWWWVALSAVVVGGITSTLLAAPVLPSQGALERIAFSISLATPALAALARFASAQFAARTDKCRRAFLYRDALGEDLSVDQQRLVALWPANTPLNRVTTERPYFSSTENRGPSRLADEIGESAFYTAELAKVMAFGGFALFAIGGFVLVFAIGTTTNFRLDADTFETFKVVTGLASVVVLTLLTAEVFITSLAYLNLSRETMDIFKSATQFVELANKNAVTALRLAESYSIALAANLPIPDSLYRLRHEQIDRAYRIRLRK